MVKNIEVYEQENHKQKKFKVFYSVFSPILIIIVFIITILSNSFYPILLGLSLLMTVQIYKGYAFIYLAFFDRKTQPVLFYITLLVQFFILIILALILNVSP